jgi:Asp-tRNA(Asn)/Glu-tRNA(Gln) amidotransferase C subunit
MIEIVLGVALALSGVALLILHRRIQKIMTGFQHLAQALTNLAEVAVEQQKVNEAQGQMNSIINQNLEILGVHTKLIEPDIAYEASAFLAWVNNKRKGKENG